MEIEFSTAKLKQLCEQEKTMTKKLGPASAKKLKSRLADIEAAENMSEVRRGRPHPLQGDLKGCLALDLSDGKRLILESTDQPPPTKEDGGIDWTKVTSVRVIQIGDYHG